VFVKISWHPPWTENVIGGCCDRIYKVFDLKNYTLLYSISDENVQEIKIRLVLKCNFSGQR
jgi:hypothetical protein